MYESYKPHPLLAQVPLTVSPFVNLPTSVTLPYTYKTVPTSLPPSVTIDASQPDGKARYVVSASGEHAAHPEEILGACRSLEQHLKKTQADAQEAIQRWETSIRERDLAEKRRVAPGWLDRDEKLLQPSRAAASMGSSHERSLLDSQPAGPDMSQLPSVSPRDEGAELDRAFGGLDMQ
ncbi:hypothetical protein ASPZODRAFT_140706 [Penicilliopsis zonata CBS 506.65]|uniref:Uncharacterized protein n=1 Tax=Penicilliopsis zonata CBS 506.65 TaxID=1073090 RepID=A0A1L9SMT6_9EURO|nr:hypothetical protein ASPZODRAFT_140706 [Penicilliopsis zonata CBS 506.65]OJJ48411.1 hypothetical protein ASPZODRAFT_140706 [Penicilliopsis zonata CBS 506.65]